MNFKEENEMDELQKLSQAINSKIEVIPPEFYYNSIVLCIIDAVFSIGVKYTGVQNVVSKFCKHEKLEKDRAYASLPVTIQNEYTIQQFIAFNNAYNLDFEHIAKNVYENKGRTSSINGILKAQAVYEFAVVLEKYGINKMVDVAKIPDRNLFEKEVKSIKGQKSGIMLSYFYMLCGVDNLVKPDRHILNFIEESIGMKVDGVRAQSLIEEYVSSENQLGKNYTCGLIDHSIWQYMSKKRRR